MLHRLSEMATERVESRVAKTLLRPAQGTPAKSRWKRQEIVETSRQRIVICALLVLQKFAGEPD
ncbi:MAG: hypothetical protein JOZ58_20110 [Acetobacteraceae bacterium]|nr:hypothetical protein [Acetobacteraceae bacterium]